MRATSEFQLGEGGLEAFHNRVSAKRCEMDLRLRRIRKNSTALSSQVLKTAIGYHCFTPGAISAPIMSGSSAGCACAAAGSSPGGGLETLRVSKEAGYAEEGAIALLNSAFILLTLRWRCLLGIRLRLKSED